MTGELLPTAVIGSYPQPDWLVDREALKSHGVPRVRVPAIWRIPGPLLPQAQDDATIVAIHDMERAGIDIISDGEMRRESYSNRFATALEGMDINNPVIMTNRAGYKAPMPRVVGAIRRKYPVEVQDMIFLRQHTSRRAKITLPGPFTMVQQAKNEYYKDDEEMAMDFAAAVNEEAHDLVAAGAEVIQLDEPWLRNDPAAAERYAVKAINRALQGLNASTAVHLCFGYGFLIPGQKPRSYDFLPQLAHSVVDQISIEAAQPNLDLGVLAEFPTKTIMLGVLDLSRSEIESAEVVAERIRQGLKYISADRLMPAPDCGMKYLTRETAFGKLQALADGAALVRRELM
jgi:5-methyltetrahydropteroyltriglutamate--homocysteine methyltransferase